MKLASTLVCHGCGHSVPPDEPYPFRCPQADLDDDGSVGFTDLLIVLAAWGPCP